MELTNEQLQEIADFNILEKMLVEAKDPAEKVILVRRIEEVQSHINELVEQQKEVINEDNTNKIINSITSNPQGTFISPELNQVLENLSQETNQSLEDILRKAIALIKIAIYSEKEGANLAIIKDGKIINEMTGFSTSAE